MTCAPLWFRLICGLIAFGKGRKSQHVVHVVHPPLSPASCLEQRRPSKKEFLNKFFLEDILGEDDYNTYPRLYTTTGRLSLSKEAFEACLRAAKLVHRRITLAQHFVIFCSHFLLFNRIPCSLICKI